MRRLYGTDMAEPPRQREQRAPITDAVAFCQKKLHRQDGRMTTEDYTDLAAIVQQAGQQ